MVSMHGNNQRLAHLQRFYALLDHLAKILAGPRKLADCSGRMGWPARGVYIFFEVGETRSDSGSGMRVVRVGTHALKAGSRTSLWQRLSQHRGVARSGGGNHRGSIFRLLVGEAIARQSGLDYPTWGQGGSARRDVRDTEQPLEQLVSWKIAAMPFLWLAVEDEPGPNSLRGYIERNAIALLSNTGAQVLDPTSGDWLGAYSGRERVRRSGLWNQNHVDESYDPDFLEVMEEQIATME